MPTLTNRISGNPKSRLKNSQVSHPFFYCLWVSPKGGLKGGKKKMYYSKNVFYMKLPKGYTIVESVDGDGITQTSLSFAFEVIFSNKALLFADKLAQLVARKEHKVQKLTEE
jgi:hypothetical protein